MSLAGRISLLAASLYRKADRWMTFLQRLLQANSAPTSNVAIQHGAIRARRPMNQYYLGY